MKIDEKVTHVIVVDYEESKHTAVATYHRTMLRYNDADFYVTKQNELHKDRFRSNRRFYVGLLIPTLSMVKKDFPECLYVSNLIELPNNYVVWTD